MIFVDFIRKLVVLSYADFVRFWGICHHNPGDIHRKREGGPRATPLLALRGFYETAVGVKGWNSLWKLESEALKN